MDTVVRASPQEYRQLQAYTRACQELSQWIDGARALALLSGALDYGVLNALHSKSTPKQIAAETNVELQSIVDLCKALETHGIVQQDDEGYQLSPDYARLASASAAVPLAHLIRQAMVINRTLLEVPSAEAPYTALPDADILAMAEGAGISSISSSPHVSQETIGQLLPEVEALWQAGSHHLEVGCGVGNSLFGILMTHPRLTAAGIEIDETTAAEAERRANLLGITDRVEVRRMDACDLQDVECFDTVQWSQFFFPTGCRQVVLEAMWRALKNGGYLVMPWLGSTTDDPSRRRSEMLRNAVKAVRSGGYTFISFLNDILSDSSVRRKKEQRSASLHKLLFRRWGVPMRSVAELKSEVEDVGFKVLRSRYTPVNQFVFTRGMLLARKDSNPGSGQTHT